MNPIESSVAPRSVQTLALPPAPAPAVVISETDAEDVSLPLSHYLWILRRHGWRIAAFVAAMVFATAIVSVRLKPLYESTATLYVDRQEAKDVVGHDSQMNTYSNLDAESFLASQIKLIQSDSVVRPVAQKYNLLEREGQIKKESDMSPAREAPIILKELKVSRPPNTYLLQATYRSPDPQLAADVANGIAASYIEHTYNIRIRSSISLSKFMERQIEELRAKMEASSGRLAQLERDLNVINPEEKTNILSARLLQLNTEYTKAQSDRVTTEAAWQATRSGTLEAAQVSRQGEGLKTLIDRMNEARQKFAEVREHFGAAHPEYRKVQATVRELQAQVDAARQNIVDRVEVEYHQASDREAMLQKSVAETKAEYDKVNARSFEYQRAKREADADKNLYDELVRKIREAGINAGFQNNTVRIADSARPAWKQVFPKLWLNLLLAFLFATALGVGLAVFADTLDNTIRDPDQAMRSLRVHTIGALPAVKNSNDLLLRTASEASGPMLVHFANGNGAKRTERKLSTYDEAIRTIRSSVLLTDFDRRIKTLLFTSATAGEGKSTTAGHLAYAHAEQGQRTVLIDCDLRRPSQHRIHGVSLGAGLSSVLTKENGWRDVITRSPSNPSLGIITAGRPSRRAVDLLGTVLPAIMEEISQEYDLIVLDAPPLLGFAESLQLAATSDGVVVVTRAGDTNRKAVSAALSTLQHLRANVVGLVLNQVKRNHSDHYYYYGYYGKYYKRYTAEAANGQPSA